MNYKILIIIVHNFLGISRRLSLGTYYIRIHIYLIETNACIYEMCAHVYMHVNFRLLSESKNELEINFVIS